MTHKPPPPTTEPAPKSSGTPWTTPIPRLESGSRQRYALLILLAILLAVVILPRPARIPTDYAAGDIARRNVKAPRDLLLQDRLMTEVKRGEAYEAVEKYYDFDSASGEEICDRLAQVMNLVRTGTPENGHHGIEVLLGFIPDAAELGLLRRIATQETILAALRRAITTPYHALVVDNAKIFVQDREHGVIVRDLRHNNEETRLGSRQVIDLATLKLDIASRIAKLEGLPLSQRRELAGVVDKMLRPNLTFNRGETELRRQTAVDAVKPVLFQIKRGEMIVREGERVTEEQVRKLNAIAVNIGGYAGSLRMALGLMLFSLILFFTAHRYGKVNIRKYRLDNRDLFFLVSTSLGYFLVMKIGLVVCGALDAAFPVLDLTTYYWLFPFAAGAMLVRIVLNSEVALIFSSVTALLIGVQFGSLPVALFAFLGSLAGAHRVRRCKERTVIYRAGLYLGLLNAVVVLLLHLLSGEHLDLQTLWGMSFALLGGVICAGIVTALIPLAEAIFRYTTDIKLLELANLDNPALRDLMVQAPGTYHHSVIVGNLVEAAAESISANPLLARVAAYYHDVGKARKPLYFIENIRDGENKHDKLTPSMSSLVLISHVRDGVEIAREHRLGTTLIDIIQQHHGTALMKFFYEKARHQHDPEQPAIDEVDYRYPGPKPQTREAALIMLADAVEAASRTLVDPTQARIHGMVQKIINNIFIDGQLDECELTLKDLHLIARSFNRVLDGIYHHRVDYPEPAYKESTKRKGSSEQNPDRESSKEAPDQSPRPAKGGAEDLKRLGMS